MRVIAPCSGERPAHAMRAPRRDKLEERVRKKVVTTTFTYDNNGNVTQKTTDGTSYDAFGQRVLQTGTSTTYLYPFKWYSVATSTGTGAKYATTIDYVFNGDTLLSTTDGKRQCDAANAVSLAKACSYWYSGFAFASLDCNSSCSFCRRLSWLCVCPLCSDLLSG